LDEGLAQATDINNFHRNKRPPTQAALLIQPLFVFRRQGQQLLNGRLIVDLFGEASASGDLDEQIGPLTADLIR
jgi:hypothetical protein